MTTTSPPLTNPAIAPTIAWVTSNPLALRTRSDDVRAVPAALKSEWIKLASLRANKVILALTPLVGALIAWALASSATDKAVTTSELFIFPFRSSPRWRLSPASSCSPPRPSTAHWRPH